jgi:putative Holliday junction resolvase
MSLRVGRILAIDPGRVRHGLAMSDPLGIFAQGLPTLESSGRRKDLEAFDALVREHEVAEIVVGHPLSMDGSRGQMTDFAERLAEDLRERTGLPVRLWDERLSSVEAERTLIARNVRREDRKGLRDRVAASLILQGFLDSRSSALPDEADESEEGST